MKNLIWMTMLLLSFLLVGCESPEESEMDLEMLAKQSYVDIFLKEEYPDATVNDLTFRNLGVYGESVVAVINDKYHWLFTEYVIELIIEGFDFSYSNGYPIRVWYNGNFSDLSAAYSEGILTKKNLETIYNIYMNKRDGQKELTGEINENKTENMFVEAMKQFLNEDGSYKDYYGGTYVNVENRNEHIILIYGDYSPNDYENIIYKNVPFSYNYLLTIEKEVSVFLREYSIVFFAILDNENKLIIQVKEEADIILIINKLKEKIENFNSKSIHFDVNPNGGLKYD